MALVVKNPSANAGDTRDQRSSLSREDPLEKEMATHSSILAWEVPWAEEPRGLQFTGSPRVHTEYILPLLFITVAPIPIFPLSFPMCVLLHNFI